MRKKEKKQKKQKKQKNESATVEKQKTSGTQKKIKNTFYYLKPKNMMGEITGYGYIFNMQKTLITYLMYTIGSIVLGILFRLNIPYIVALVLIGFLFLPRLIVSTYKNMYEQRRFIDANVYMEQILYSFKKSKKLVTSLQDIKIQFKNGPMYDLIDRAEKHILTAYDSKEDVELEALRMIEAEYQCVKLKTIHRFLLKVENLGGTFDNTIDLLLTDRSMWEERQIHLQQEKRKKKNLVIASIVMSIVLCMVFIRLLPGEMDISKNIIVQVMTVIMWFLDCIIYVRADSKLSSDWLQTHEIETPQESLRRYNKVMNFDNKKEFKKSCLFSAVGVIIGLLVFLIGYKWIAAFFFVLSILMLFQHKLDYHMAKKKLIQEIERKFPQWLMEMSLLLQSDSVQVSLYKSFDNAPVVLKPELEKMYLKLQNNPTAIEPYLEFMEEFDIKNIQSAMKMLYSLSAGTGGNSEVQIEDIIRRNNMMLNDVEKAANDSSMASMYVLFGMPALVGGAKLVVDMAIFFFVSMSNMGNFV